MYIHKIELLNTSLKLLADKYNVGIVQISVTWAIDKGTLPIIGVTKERHVADAVRATEITLTPEEIALLESTANKLDFKASFFLSPERWGIDGSIWEGFT